MKKLNQAVILFCDSSSGRYIPQRFANEVKRENVVGVSMDYLGSLDQGWVKVDKYVSIVGGYSDDFSQE